MTRPGPHHIGTKGAVDGNALIYSKATDEYAPGAIPGVGSVVAGTGVTVDNTDPAHPIVSIVASSGEVLMADGVTSPPVPLENEAGDDWLYQD